MDGGHGISLAGGSVIPTSRDKQDKTVISYYPYPRLEARASFPGHSTQCRAAPLCQAAAATVALCASSLWIGSTQMASRLLPWHCCGTEEAALGSGAGGAGDSKVGGRGGPCLQGDKASAEHAVEQLSRIAHGNHGIVSHLLLLQLLLRRQQPEHPHPCKQDATHLSRTSPSGTLQRPHDNHAVRNVSMRVFPQGGAVAKLPTAPAIVYTARDARKPQSQHSRHYCLMATH